MALPIIAKDSIEDLQDYIKELPSDTTVQMNSTDLILLEDCYRKELVVPKSFEALLKADIEEILYCHYGYTEKEIKQFLYINLSDLVEESYKAQTEHLLTAVNKFKGI